jgi:hypothetical protein
MVDRIALKAMTSTSSGLSSQQIIDLANDSLRSYIVPFTARLREEWWVGATDYVVSTDSNGMILMPDTVAQSMRTVSWKNSGVLVPLTRIEPENSFGYLPFNSNLPTGFQMRGNTLQVLPKAAGIEIHITGMLRPSQMVLTENAGLVASKVGAALTLSSVPLEWQAAAPTSVDLIAGSSPFGVWGTSSVVSLVGSVLTLGADGLALINAIPTPMAGWDLWVSDPATSPFASIPAELYALLEQDVVCTLHAANGDKRLAGAEKRRELIAADIKSVAAPRTTGNARPIVNPSAPGYRAFSGLWPRR